MTYNNRIGLLCLILAFAVVSISLWIFGNSLKNGVESDKDSSRVIERVKPVIDPQNKISREIFNFTVRKTAHFTEYCFLGMCSTALTFAIFLKKQKKYYLLPFMFTLFNGAFDEIIQSQTGRTSSIVDVLIDFCGAIFGIVLFTAAVWLVKAAFNRKKSRKNPKAM